MSDHLENRTVIRAQVAGDVYIIRIAGDIDQFHAKQVKQVFLKLVAGGARKLVVDVASATYIDSAGVGSLLYMFSESKKRNVRFLLSGTRGPVLRVIELTKLNEYFPRVERLVDGIAQLKD